MEMILSSIFFFNDTAPTEIYTLSLHDALPILSVWYAKRIRDPAARLHALSGSRTTNGLWSITTKGAHERGTARSEEHTSELQSRQYLVCRLLLEKKTKTVIPLHYACTITLHSS